MRSVSNQTSFVRSVSQLALAFAAVVGTQAAAQDAASPGAAEDASASIASDEIVVTAQKRAQSVNDVAMSINAITGEDLTRRGITDISDLVKIVPGLNYNSTSSGMPVYTIRGVGFQESSLAASPTVSVYVDEIPIPFPAETQGASLDLERVEVLKGPQGTLYGQNSTGGAINYIAAKPTNQFKFGADASFGRFNTTDLSGFVSGPLSSTMRVRIASRLLQANDWQRSHTRNDTNGSVNLLTGRVLFDWDPTENLTIALNLNGWRDRSESPAAQLSAIIPQSTPEAIPPILFNAPLAPDNARAADWDAGRPLQRDNRFYQASLRADYSLSDAVQLTSISSYQKFERDQPVDGDGTRAEAIYYILTGSIETFFQELRLTGEIGRKGSWIVGANYEWDKIGDSNLIFFSESSSGTFGGQAENENTQKVDTKSIYANADFELVSDVSLLGGVRYTRANRSFVGCTRDLNGALLPFFSSPANPVPVGGCVTALVAGGLGLVRKDLNEDNISWRVGLNYEPTRDLLLYANISKGYKSGSFPLLSVLLEQQATPVTQESLLAYEAGVKATLLDRALQLNAAVFYYDYKNKQIRGSTDIPPFGALETLVNIPKSHVFGFEVGATIQPIEGLKIAPAVTLVKSQIDGSFFNYTFGNTTGDFGGEPFPYTPKWSGNTDAEYRWSVSDNLRASVGGTLSYQAKTNASFGQLSQFRIPGRALLDLRAGVESGDGTWSASVWARNVTNRFYWTTVSRFGDVASRWTGMPATYGVSVTLRP